MGFGSYEYFWMKTTPIHPSTSQFGSNARVIVVDSTLQCLTLLRNYVEYQLCQLDLFFYVSLNLQVLSICCEALFAFRVLDLLIARGDWKNIHIYVLWIA